MTNDKAICLLSDNIPDNELTTLKTHYAQLKSMNLLERVKWIKNHMPQSTRQAFRTFTKEKFVVKNRYQPWSK